MTEQTKEEKEADAVLTREVYDALVEIVDSRCTMSAVFHDGPCKENEKKCPACIAKPLEARVRDRLVSLDYHNVHDDLNTYWEALYAIRCVAEHTGGKKSTAKKMRGEIDHMREMADDAIETVNPRRRTTIKIDPIKELIKAHRIVHGCDPDFSEVIEELKAMQHDCPVA